MAQTDLGKGCDNIVYGIIGNIPSFYHSSDLRNFFSEAIETNLFDCFHFRHRPEEKRIKKDVSERDKPTMSMTSRPMAMATCMTTSSSCKTVNNNMDVVNKTSKVSSSSPLTTGNTHVAYSDTLPALPDRAATKYAKTTTCSVVRMKDAALGKLIKTYHRKHWLDKHGESIPALCFISRIKVPGEKQKLQKKYRTREEMCHNPLDREDFTREDLHKLAELHPPPIMPNGNVGTPTSIFMDLIKECKLPPGVISKLGLTFPKKRGRRIYATVPFDYGSQCDVIDVNHDELSPSQVRSQKGYLLEDENPNISQTIEARRKRKLDNMPAPDEVEPNGSDQSEEDDDDCEEWERHEALHDDPANYERNKERVFEEEMEIVWEKGGSGLVFYTDSQFWRQKEDGDFDEQTADDWDVDMSAYYDPDGGDKDARDYIQIRQEQRRRSGKETTDRFTSGLTIGSFERHTKGIGRKVLEKQGWQDGKGIGSSVTGIAVALDNDGQKPRDKTGFGYLGEKVDRSRHVTASRKRQLKTDEPIISTVYDDHSQTDPSELLLRRANPHQIKYRAIGQGVLFHKARTPVEKS